MTDTTTTAPTFALGDRVTTAAQHNVYTVVDFLPSGAIRILDADDHTTYTVGPRDLLLVDDAEDRAAVTRCTRCTKEVVRTRSGKWVTGNAAEGWILPSHLNGTCDGTHLHRVD